MKSVFISILIISFVGIALFGIFSMHVDMQNHDGRCIAPSIQGTDCPKQSNSLIYITFHLDAFRGLSTLALGNNFFASLLAITMFLVGVGLAFLFNNIVKKKSSTKHYNYKKYRSFKSPAEKQLLNWLALHENSPAIF